MYYKLVRLVRGRQWFLGMTKIPATSKFIAQWKQEYGPSSFCRFSLTPNCDSQFLDFLYFCEKKDIS